MIVLCGTGKQGEIYYPGRYFMGILNMPERKVEAGVMIIR